jgi:hypothetical protein
MPTMQRMLTAAPVTPCVDEQVLGFNALLADGALEPARHANCARDTQVENLGRSK